MSLPRTGDFASVKTRSLQLENTDGTQPTTGSVLTVSAAGVAGWTRGPDVDTLTARNQIVLMDGETHSGALSYSFTEGLMLNGSSITGDGGGGGMGPQGHTGHTGPQGHTGHTGHTGPQGHTGHTGPQGHTGHTGHTGPQGHTGNTGPQGHTGHTGPIGPLGPSGEQGHTGHTGPIGPLGPSGEQGHTGPQGHTGHTGPQGHTGHTGPIGPLGPSGEQGHTGPQGHTGHTGHTGPQGPSGEQGHTGHTGHTGPSGEQGHTGHTGADGPTGPTGPKGDSTIMGITGGNGITVSGSTGDSVIAWSGNYSGQLSISRNLAVSDVNSNPLQSQIILNGDQTTNRLLMGTYYTAGVGAPSAIQASDYYEGSDHGESLLMNPLGGYVGIGTTTPTATLDVLGSVKISGSLNTGETTITSGGLRVSNGGTVLEGGLLVNNGGTIIQNGADITGGLRISTGNTEIVSGGLRLSDGIIDINGGARISGVLDVSGNIALRGPIYVGSSDTENKILFHGTTNDESGNFSSTYISERIYGGLEQSELLLFKANDAVNPSGPDRIRLHGGNIVLETYPSYETADVIDDGSIPAANRVIMDSAGNVGIGKTPTTTLDVAGNLNAGAATLNSITLNNYNEHYVLYIGKSNINLLQNNLVPFNRAQGSTTLTSLEVSDTKIKINKDGLYLIVFNYFGGDNGSGTRVEVYRDTGGQMNLNLISFNSGLNVMSSGSVNINLYYNDYIYVTKTSSTGNSNIFQDMSLSITRLF